MKKIVIGLIGAVVVIAFVLYYFSSKKNNSGNLTSTPNSGNGSQSPVVNGTPPAVVLSTATSTTVSPERNIISHMVWLDANAKTWVTQVKSDNGFTYNQALAFLAIREGKFNNKDVPLDYAGTTERNGHVAWVKKYVA